MVKSTLNCTRVLRELGNSYLVTLNKSLLKRKGYEVGDVVRISINREDDIVHNTMTILNTKVDVEELN